MSYQSTSFLSSRFAICLTEWVMLRFIACKRELCTSASRNRSFSHKQASLPPRLSVRNPLARVPRGCRESLASTSFGTLTLLMNTPLYSSSTSFQYSRFVNRVLLISLFFLSIISKDGAVLIFTLPSSQPTPCRNAVPHRLIGFPSLSIAIEQLQSYVFTSIPANTNRLYIIIPVLSRSVISGLQNAGISALA